MRLHKFLFDTEREAQCFLLGVDFVNDSSLSTFLVPFEDEGVAGYCVFIEDEDGLAGEQEVKDYRAKMTTSEKVTA